MFGNFWVLSDACASLCTIFHSAGLVHTSCSFKRRSISTCLSPRGMLSGSDTVFPILALLLPPSTATTGASYGICFLRMCLEDVKFHYFLSTIIKGEESNELLISYQCSSMYKELRSTTSKVDELNLHTAAQWLLVQCARPQMAKRAPVFRGGYTVTQCQ